MKGSIIKIHPMKNSRNGNRFIRVEFRMEDKSWAKTDICPDYRNYARWKDLLRSGVTLTGLNKKRDNEVDADSFPQLFSSGNEGKYVMQADGSMSFIKKVEPEKIEEVPEVGLIQEKLI